MNSFNVYGQTETQFGGHTPVWLGTVKPIPRGAVLNTSNVPPIFNKGSKVFIPAGTPVAYGAYRNNFEPCGKETLGDANAYLYNDICYEIEEVNAGGVVTGAIVQYHPEGLLIERVCDIGGSEVESLQAQIPGVLLVYESNQD